MKLSTLITLICIRNTAFVYAIFSFITFDYNISNWNIWVRAIFIIWTIVECYLTSNRIKDNHDN